MAADGPGAVHLCPDAEGEVRAPLDRAEIERVEAEALVRAGGDLALACRILAVNLVYIRRGMSAGYLRIPPPVPSAPRKPPLSRL